MGTLTQPDPPTLVANAGGRFAAGLGIDVVSLRPGEIYKWFVAALLYGARISENIASRTWHEFERCGLLTPQRMIDAGWDRLVAALDRGGYVRYDYKTATKLLDASRALLADYGGDLNALHAAAADAADLQRRIMALGKGIGQVTAGIFLRELRGAWAKADPPLSPLACRAAQALGFLPRGSGDDYPALDSLRKRWTGSGMAPGDFPDFEAALVREGLRLRRRPEPRHDPHS